MRRCVRVCLCDGGWAVFWLKLKKLHRVSLFEIEPKLAYWNLDWMAFWLKPKMPPELTTPIDDKILELTDLDCN